MKKMVLILMITLVGVVAWSQSFLSSDELKKASEEITKEKLAGVPGFFVSVSVSPDSLALLLPINSVQTDVELKLRIARIPVLTLSQALMTHGGMITVNVDGVRSRNDPRWAISLIAECKQQAHLDRNPDVATLDLTWEDGAVVMYSETVVSEFREVVKDTIDALVNLYLAANP